MRTTLAEGEGALEHLRAAGLDDWAAQNTVAYLAEQAEATGVLPDDQTIVVERFPDELGDWRVMIHSVFGSRVNAPWAAVLAGRLKDLYGLDGQVMHSDDGIMLRLPETAEDDAAASLDPFIEPDEVADAVTASLAGSAHFAARFREAAARALVLPRAGPGRRSPLWQQRHRAHQLLGVAAQFNDFPIIHEAVRECVRDDFDLDALKELMSGVAAREIRVVSVTCPAPSPFARSVAFGYTAQFLYDGDAPLAERRAAALSLDPTMLAELMGSGPASDLADLLDGAVVMALDAELAWRTEERRVRHAERLVDMLRTRGPLSRGQVLESLGAGLGEAELESWITELSAARRIITVRIGGTQRWAAVEDAAALRDGLGVSLPLGLPEQFLAPVPDPLGGLIRRYIRCHGPFRPADMGSELGLGVAVAVRELDALVHAGQLTSGRLRPPEAGGSGGTDYCDPGIVTRLRRRSLAALRQQVEPVEPAVLGVFLPRWQQLGKGRGPDGVLAAIGQLGGAAVPASALESVILPARVTDYAPAMLDELITAGEVSWCGQGRSTGTDGSIRVFATATQDAALASVGEVTGTAADLLDLLSQGGAFLAEELTRRLPQDPGAAGLLDALWDLVWAGFATADSFAPMRAWLRGGKTAHKTQRRVRARPMLTRRALLQGPGMMRPGQVEARLAGRWSLAATPAATGVELDAGERLAAVASALLERNGILTRGSVAVETSFSTLYPLLSALEEAGTIRRGYYVEHLGGSQFALPPCPDQLRACADATVEHDVVCLAAADPANPYGAALGWPPHPAAHRPGRGAGALVVLVRGELALYSERGGRSVLAFASGQDLVDAAKVLAERILDWRLGPVKIKRIDGEDALQAHAEGQEGALALIAAGFTLTPGGLRLRTRPVHA
jgi:ATP-dependent Lhr-like helicase